ncbi:MAG: hypothetical protein H0U63_01120 [Burkholderiales bacterium]|nr:hypothetical protein [Burkholderiales bacterium]
MADRKPCERYLDLPEHTKLFFESLTAEDIVSIKEGIALAKATKTMAKFWKWTFMLAVGAFAGAAAIGQSFEWFWSKLVRGP